MDTTDSMSNRTSPPEALAHYNSSIGTLSTEYTQRLGNAVAAKEGEGNVGDSALLWFMLATGMIPVLVAASHGGRWGTEPTLGLLLAMFAAYQLVVNREKNPGN